MANITWKHFDADRPDADTAQRIRELQDEILSAKGVDKGDRTAIVSFAQGEISAYRSRLNPEANETVGISLFRPHEFDEDSSNDPSLAELTDWLRKQRFNWLDGSKTVQIALRRAFPPGGPTKVEGGRETVILDNLVLVAGRKVAIEVETSNNLDNGYWTLRQAIRKGMANYGVMIVPWTAEGQGRADEGKALGRLDREFDGGANLKDGPVYRLAIVRRLDLFKLMLDE